MRNVVEILAQIGVYHIRITFTNQPMDFLNRILSASLRSISVSIRLQIRLEDRLQHQFGRGLRHSVPYGRDTQWPFAAIGLRDHHPSHRLGPVRSCTALPAGRPTTSAALPIQSPRSSDYLFLEPPDWLSPTRRRVPGCLPGRFCRRANRSGSSVPASPCCIASFEAPGCCSVLLDSWSITSTFASSVSLSEVRVLGSTGITRLPRYYDPLRGPSQPPSFRWR